MKWFPLLFLAALCIISASEKCAPVTQEDCENMTSEYEKYRACMERRTKRSPSCYEDEDVNCDKCDCDSCSYSSCNNCNNNCCTQCCQRSSCSTYSCCHQSCRAECKSNSCRTACKRKCQDVPTNIQTSSVVSQSKPNTQHNITTVIHLNNVINNTNLINLPINVNNTVLNNITNEGRFGGYGGFERTVISEEGSKDNCCLTVGPRQCIRQTTFPFVRCFHVRKKTCGNICMAPIVHYQTHEICDNDVNQQQPCRQQIVYVPQPQPRCAFQQTWPYVTCGNQNLQSCDGCYSHYVKREEVTKCSNFCYDDGYGIGPYYRQAPFYRPGFAHVPSCYQTGLCDMFDGYGYNYGYGFGNGYEGLPENSFPSAYPPQTYPFIIEDCKNCTFPWDSPNSQEPVHQLNYKNLQSTAISNNVPDKIINIDANVKPLRPERYAEIRIKPTRKSKTITIPTTSNTEKTTVT